MMNLQKTLFIFMMNITIIQAIDARQDQIFEFIMNNDAQLLQDYLTQNPHAIHAKNTKNQSVLYTAIYLKKTLEIIKILLDAGANPNEIISHTDSSVPGRAPKIDTLLHKLATRYSHSSDATDKNHTAELVAWLLIYGADDSITDSKGRTARQISPALFQASDTLKEQELQRERQAFEALFGAELRHNTGTTETVYNLLGQPTLTHEKN